MAGEYQGTAEFRGASFRVADLRGATFRDCDLSGVRIVSSRVAGLYVSGFDGCAGTVVVDDVDVTAFVAAELDRRHPERVRLRAVRTAADYRAMWDILEHLWSDTVARAERLPESARRQRVDGEWSFVETLRHLVFAVDSWVGRMIRAERAPYHRLGLPPTDCSAAAAAELGLDPAAHPPYAEVLAAYADRAARVRDVVGGLTDGDLDQVRTGALMPGEDPESHSVGECLRVVLAEHCAHHRYTVRDLARLETG